MRIDEIRQLSQEDLRKELDSSFKELLNLRFRLATRQLADVSQVRKARQKVARIKTVLREWELTGG